MWQAMIVLHSLAGVGAFLVGLAALQPARLRRHPWLAPVLLWLLVALVVSMAGAMASHWNELPVATRLAFSGLFGLGVYMLHRARLGGAAASGPDPTRSIDDVGFLLISLFDGFVIVTALDLGAPPWLVAAAAAGAVLVGHRLVARRKLVVERAPIQPSRGR